MPKQYATKIDENGRVCTKCHKFKPWSEYHLQNRHASGYMSHCRDCQKNIDKRYSGEYGNEKKRNEKYGLLFGQFEKMVEEQNGKCKICGCIMTLETGKSNSVKVDHCHKTGKIRGLLCSCCNLGVGLFKENVNALAQAIIYLKGEA